MSQAKTWVGLDVHVSGTVAAVLDRESGELRRRRLPGRAVEVAAFVAGRPGPVCATYEAGPTGFALALSRPGFDGGLEAGLASWQKGMLRPDGQTEEVFR